MIEPSFLLHKAHGLSLFEFTLWPLDSIRGTLQTNCLIFVFIYLIHIVKEHN